MCNAIRKKWRTISELGHGQTMTRPWGMWFTEYIFTVYWKKLSVGLISLEAEFKFKVSIGKLRFFSCKDLNYYSHYFDLFIVFDLCLISHSFDDVPVH